MRNIIRKINEKSNYLKTKNALAINRINHELENLLKIGEKIIQMCLSERSELMNEYEALDTLCQSLEANCSEISSSCNSLDLNQIKRQTSKKSLKTLFSDLGMNLAEAKDEQYQKQVMSNYAVYIPDTCVDDVFDQAKAEKHLKSSREPQAPIKDTMENLIEQEEEYLAQTNKRLKLPQQFHKEKLVQTPNSVKKVLNEHGLHDSTITTISSVVNSPLIKHEVTHKSDNIENVLNYSDEFRPTKSKAPSLTRKLTQTKLEIHSTPKKTTTSNAIQHTITTASNVSKIKLKQLTMNQALDNAKRNSSKLSEISFQVEETPEKQPKVALVVETNKWNRLTNNPNASLNETSQHDETVVEPLQVASYKRNSTRQLISSNSDTNDENKSQEDDQEDLIFKFDQLPKKQKQQNSPSYKYAQVVRKQEERKRLQTTTCRECEQYWMSVPEELRPKQMQDTCKHRHKHLPPSTPEHFWSLAFPNTQECIERGYGGVLVEDNEGGPMRARRKRPLRLLNQQQSNENKNAND